MMQIQISSPAFERNRMIPSRYTCDGDDISPPLTWEAVPGGTSTPNRITSATMRTFTLPKFWIA